MQRVHFSAGEALCRFCGEQVSTNRLSIHIAKEHPRPEQIDMSPTLVRKPAAVRKQLTEQRATWLRPRMKPWETLGRARLAGGAELTLVRHPSEFAILANGRTLMSSRMHGSEEALARLGRARTMRCPSVLIGGLGMGFTLRAVLDTLPPMARVRVTELVPAVVEWNRGPLGTLAQHPLDDPRVQIEAGDVAATIRASRARFDDVLLDLDNGSVAMTARSNAVLYTNQGIAAARAAVRPGGILALWSATDDRRFACRRRAEGFDVERPHVRGGLTRGPRHSVVIAHNSDASTTSSQTCRSAEAR